MGSSTESAHIFNMVRERDTSRAAIGRRLRETREALGMNQASFARLVKISPQAINNYERGYQRPHLDQAFLICRATGATLDWIYMGDPSGLPGRIFQKIDSGNPESGERRA